MRTNATTLTYDDENRVTGITYPNSSTNSFAYNGLGLRVSKNDSAGAFAYVCDGTGVASPVLKDGAATYTPGLSERRGTVSKFTHKDALGSTRGVTDSTQATTDSMLFDAFGMTVSRTGTTPTPFGFVGGAQYQTDADSGLMLLGHRYYDASVGRFISEDPIQAGDNWYAYCENNPLNSSDPSGLDDEKKYPIHVVKHPTRKKAEEAARQDGKGKPVDHKNDKNGGPPHLHPVDKGGNKIPGVHHEYPRKGPAVPKIPPKKPEEPITFTPSPPQQMFPGGEGSLGGYDPRMTSGINWGEVGKWSLIGAVGIGLATGLLTGQPEVALPCGYALKELLAN